MYVSEYPLGVTNYNFGGSCEATAVDALVHANTRSIPFPFPGSSLTPLCHPTPSNLPSLSWVSLSLPPTLASSPSLFPSLIPPRVTSFSHAHAALYRFISHRTRPLPLATSTLSPSILALSHTLFPLDPFAVWLACWTPVGSQVPSIDLSNFDLIGFSRVVRARARAYTLFFLLHVRNCVATPPDTTY